MAQRSIVSIALTAEELAAVDAYKDRQRPPAGRGPVIRYFLLQGMAAAERQREEEDTPTPTPAELMDRGLAALRAEEERQRAPVA